MGLFKKLFGGDDASSKDSDSKGAQDKNAAAKDAKESEPVFYADGEDEVMLKAFEQARKSFRYFWRELYCTGSASASSLRLALPALRSPFRKS